MQRERHKVLLQFILDTTMEASMADGRRRELFLAVDVKVNMFPLLMQWSTRPSPMKVSFDSFYSVVLLSFFKPMEILQ